MFPWSSKSVSKQSTNTVTHLYSETIYIKKGLDVPGIYKGSNTTRVQKLKVEFEMDPRRVNLHDPEWRSDIASVASLMKLYLRELPDPVLSRSLSPKFIEAISKPHIVFTSN